MSKMKFNAVCCACVLLAAPLVAQAQASGESAETGPSEARQGGRGATRSALWLAVEAHFRQPDGAPAAPGMPGAPLSSRVSTDPAGASPPWADATRPLSLAF